MTFAAGTAVLVKDEWPEAEDLALIATRGAQATMADLLARVGAAPA